MLNRIVEFSLRQRWAILNDTESIGVIHAIHGVNADGEWFLLADLADGLTRAGDPAPLAPRSIQPERLVILSDRELAVASLPPPET